MKKGILLMALGHPYYGRMAFNLAVSLKNSDPEIQIALVYTKSAISHLGVYQIENYFDKMIEASEKCYMTDGRTDYLKAKTFIYDLSPFEKTLFLDADMIWMPNKPVSELLASLEGVSLTFSNHSTLDLKCASPEALEQYSFWGDVKQFMEVYGINEGKYPSLHSEFILFDKSAENKKYFSKVKKLYADPKITTTPFGLNIADELAFAMALVIQGKELHATPFNPIFWQAPLKEHKLLPEIKNLYWGYSVGGANYPDVMKLVYDTLAKWHFQTAGLQYPYLLQPKSSYLSERKYI